MQEVKMKVIGREKRQIGVDEYSYFYLVQFPDIPDKLNTTYYGNGERGVLCSFTPLFHRYENGWATEKLEDLRDKDAAVPEKVKKHIQKLADEWVRKNNHG